MREDAVPRGIVDRNGVRTTRYFRVGPVTPAPGGSVSASPPAPAPVELDGVARRLYEVIGEDPVDLDDPTSNRALARRLAAARLYTPVVAYEEEAQVREAARLLSEVASDERSEGGDPSRFSGSGLAEVLEAEGYVEVERPAPVADLLDAPGSVFTEFVSDASPDPDSAVTTLAVVLRCPGGEPVASASTVEGRLAYSVPGEHLDPRVLALPATRSDLEVAVGDALARSGADRTLAPGVVDALLSEVSLPGPERRSLDAVAREALARGGGSDPGSREVVTAVVDALPRPAVEVLATSPFSPSPTRSYAAASPGADAALRAAVLESVGHARER